MNIESLPQSLKQESNLEFDENDTNINILKEAQEEFNDIVWAIRQKIEAKAFNPTTFEKGIRNMLAKIFNYKNQASQTNQPQYEKLKEILEEAFWWLAEEEIIRQKTTRLICNSNEWKSVFS